MKTLVSLASIVVILCGGQHLYQSVAADTAAVCADIQRNADLPEARRRADYNSTTVDFELEEMRISRLPEKEQSDAQAALVAKLHREMGQ